MHSSIVFSGLLAFVLAALPAAAAPAAGEGKHTPRIPNHFSLTKPATGTSTVTIQGCKPGTVRKTASKMVDGREFAKYECDSIPKALATPAPGTLVARASDLCGAQCPTSCFGSAYAGCHVFLRGARSDLRLQRQRAQRGRLRRHRGRVGQRGSVRFIGYPSTLLNHFRHDLHRERANVLLELRLLLL
jgi:hypothetical protein